MKTINWKGNISALIIILFVAASYFFVHKDEFMPQDASYITAKADINTDDITADDTISDDSPIVDDYTQDKTKQDPAIGMTVQEVNNSTWGRAGDITTSKDKYGNSQLWFYQDGKSIFFVNGLVESITEVK